MLKSANGRLPPMALDITTTSGMIRLKDLGLRQGFVHGDGREARHRLGFGLRQVTQAPIKGFAGTRAVQSGLVQSLIDQPAFKITHQRLADSATKPLRHYIAKRNLPLIRRHRHADRFVVQQGKVEIQTLVREPMLDVFVGLILSPGRNDLRLVTMVKRATDADGTLDDAADDTGVGWSCLASVYGFVHCTVPQSIECQGTIVARNPDDQCREVTFDVAQKYLWERRRRFDLPAMASWQSILMLNVPASSLASQLSQVLCRSRMMLPTQDLWCLSDGLQRHAQLNPQPIRSAVEM
jgi:hypothetical protein